MNSDDRPARPSWHHRHFSRRRFLAGAAALSAGALVAAGCQPSRTPPNAGDGLHGVPLRGMYLTSKDRLAEGRFGTMFKRLPAFAPRDDLLDGLAETMVEDQTSSDIFLTTSPRLFAGFTFIGQFIDHDITFDNTPLASSRRTPMPRSTSGRRATTSTRSTGAGRSLSRSSTIRPTGTSCWWRRISTVSRTCRVTATPGDHPGSAQ